MDMDMFRPPPGDLSALAVLGFEFEFLGARTFLWGERAFRVLSISEKGFKANWKGSRRTAFPVLLSDF